MNFRTTAVAATGIAVLALGSIQPALAQGTNGPAHALAMHGTPKYAAGFEHFDYVDPNAQKGGTQVSAVSPGTFDSLNPFILQGTPAGVGIIYDSLMTSSVDEAFTEYCLLCETVETPDDRSWVEFVLRDDAFWHDGTPITVEDVIFTFETLLAQGRPFYRFYYGDVAGATKTGPRSVRFDFSNPNPELPLIMGQLTVLPKHYWESRDFSKTTLEPPLGSSAYRISRVEPGRTIEFERVEDYWAADHPTEVGFNNIDVLRFEYFRDRTVAREAFKSGDIDIWIENSSKDWATAFDTPAHRGGLLITEEFPHQQTAGMQGFVLNTRKAIFDDRRVREALSYAFDFEWSNQNLFYGAYTRTDSYFDNSRLASSGLLKDADAEEREILERFRGQLPEDVYTKAFSVPKTDGSGSRGLRPNLRTARGLLEEAGWVVREGRLVNRETDARFEFEIMLVSPAFERIVLPLARNLERLGIDVNVRLVDVAQYQERLESYDFDVIVSTFGQSLSPGNEQRDYWSSAAAERRGSRNYIGVNDPAIDELIELIITAPTRESLVQRTRALDRALLWGHYVIPNWHIPHDRIAYWDKYGKPETVTTLRGAVTGAWWIDSAKEASLADRRSSASN